MQKSPQFFNQSEQALSHHSNKYQMITKCTLGYFLWLFWFVHVRASLLIKETLVHFTRLWYQYKSWDENLYLCWNEHFNVRFFFMKPNCLVTNPRILFQCTVESYILHIWKKYIMMIAQIVKYTFGLQITLKASLQFFCTLDMVSFSYWKNESNIVKLSICRLFSASYNSI